jgi:predicted dehydrogenase
MCDANGYVLDVLSKYTGLRAVTDYEKLLQQDPLDAVVIATPTRMHHPMVRSALERRLHVFCEKPLTLSSRESRELAALAKSRGVHGQVGYHNRFVAAFAEAKRLVDAGALGTIRHAQAEAYGPVVLRSKGGTWRSQRSEGGGCLYDYAAHPLDLLAWYLGAPSAVGGTSLGRIFSAATEDEAYATLFYPDGVTAQLSVNWSDESYRKMSTRITLTGTAGRLSVDRQECQVYLRDTAPIPPGYQRGWNVRYTTDLTDPVWFYLRGEEYSAELDHFVRAAGGSLGPAQEPDLNSFASAAVTDQVIEWMLLDADVGPRAVRPDDGDPAAPRDRWHQLRTLRTAVHHRVASARAARRRSAA